MSVLTLLRTRFVRSNPDADRLAIWDVMMRYAAAVDRVDFAMIEECFSTKAQCTYNGERLTDGKRGVTDYLKSRQAGIFDRATPAFAIHFVGNVHVELSRDTATAQTYAVRYIGMPTEHGVVLESRGLQYDDRLIREGGRWVISERELVGLWETP